MYIYDVKYRTGQEGLFELEMKYLFGIIPDNKYFISPKNIDVDRSPYVKCKIKVILVKDSLIKLKESIIKEKMTYENFKVKFVDLEGNTPFLERHNIEGIIGFEINGDANVKNPDVILGVTVIDGRWYFGEYEKSAGLCNDHDKRPFYYCNSLTTRFARSLVNIVLGVDTNKTLIDPCCGIGTVVVEALSMGINVKGYDINPLVVSNAKENLRYFGFPDVIDLCDIKDVEGRYDAAIVDLPYGVLSISSRDMQGEIISKAAKLTNKMAVVSIDSVKDLIEGAGFKIIDSCRVDKGKFKRYVSLCEKSL